MEKSDLRTIDIQGVPELLRNPIDYRKSGLSINNVIGCPLDCSYCIRNDLDNYDMKKPEVFMSDEAAVEKLIKNKFFRDGITPIQIFNRATDPFLSKVKSHTFNILSLLDKAINSNHVLVITRYKVTREDAIKLNSYRNIKLTVLVTYSGIDDKKIEPLSSDVAINSLKTLYKYAENYKVIMYWRPIISGVNDSIEHIKKAVSIAKHSHATVFSGLFYRDSIKDNFVNNGIDEPYSEAARRKILPTKTEESLIDDVKGKIPNFFKKTSCAISFLHGLADYNGHYGIPEICDICPENQKDICKKSFVTPSHHEVESLCNELNIMGEFIIKSGAIEFEGLDESERYFLQHTLGFQVHDKKYPHVKNRHGKAAIEI